MGYSPWFVEHKNILRFTTLIVFVITMFGPWMFDRISVPAEYTCDLPNIRLNDDFCGLPLSGFQFLVWFAGGFFYIIFELIRGVFSGPLREMMSGLSLLLLLPSFTTILLLLGKGSRRLRTINLVLWTLAFLLSLTVFILQIKDQVMQLWGLWLYIILVISALIFELFILKGQPKHE